MGGHDPSIVGSAECPLGARRATSTTVQTLRDSVTPTFGRVRRTRSRLPPADGGRTAIRRRQQIAASVCAQDSHEHALSSNRGRPRHEGQRGRVGPVRRGRNFGPFHLPVCVSAPSWSFFSANITARSHATITSSTHSALAAYAVRYCSTRRTPFRIPTTATAYAHTEIPYTCVNAINPPPALVRSECQPSSSMHWHTYHSCS